MVAERGSREHISERIAEQIVDPFLDDRTTQASAKAFANELDALMGATQGIQSETGGAGQAYSLFQESSSGTLQATTDLEGFEVRTTVRWLSKQEHSTSYSSPHTLAQS